MYRYITAFTQHLHAMGSHQRTQQAYQRDVSQFILYMMDQCNIHTIEDISQHDVDRYIHHLEHKCITRSTAQRKWSALMYFFTFANLDLYVPRVTNMLDIFCTDTTLLETATQLLSSSDPYAIRDGLMLACIYHIRKPFAHIAPCTKGSVQEKRAMYIQNHKLPSEMQPHMRAYIIRHLPTLYGTSVTSEHLLFPYLPHNTRHPVQMPRTVFLSRCRHHIAQYLQHCHGTRARAVTSSYANRDATLYKRYMKYHVRA